MGEGSEQPIKGSGEPIEVDEESFDALVRQADGPVLVDCWAVWCGPCRKTNPIMRALARDYPERLTVAKLDMDSNRYMTGELEITGLPSFILFKDGEELDRLVGGLDRVRFEEMLRRHGVID